MRHPWLFVVVLVLSCMQCSIGQQVVDFQIMVNGPWAYVTDPDPSGDHNPNADTSNRIVIVVPAYQQSHHRTFVNTGVDATQLGGVHLDPGLYYFDLNNRTSRRTRPVGELPPVIYPAPQTVSSTQIATVLMGSDAVAISLPQPDFYSTYAGQYGVGFAESKVEPSPGITSANATREFTVWMVLHYQLQAPVSKVTCSACPGSKGNTDILVQDNGISIVSGVKGKRSFPNCDSWSMESFGDSKKLWNLVHYARFPQEIDDSGTQNRGVYDYDHCPEAFADISNKQRAFEGALDDRQATLQAIATFDNCLRKLQGQPLKQTAVGQKLSRTASEPKPDCQDPEKRRQHASEIRAAVSDLSFGIIPEPIRGDLDCMDALARNPGASCGRTAINHVQQVVTKGIGSTDCHVGQMSINVDIK